MSDFTTTAFINADYEEYKPETFNGFVVTIYSADNSVVTEGRFQISDDAMRFASQADKIVQLSSVDHYLYDLRRPTQSP